MLIKYQENDVGHAAGMADREGGGGGGGELDVGDKIGTCIIAYTWDISLKLFGSFHVKSTQNKYDPSRISSNLVWRRCLWIKSATSGTIKYSWICGHRYFCLVSCTSGSVTFVVFITQIWS